LVHGHRVGVAPPVARSGLVALILGTAQAVVDPLVFDEVAAAREAAAAALAEVRLDAGVHRAVRHQGLAVREPLAAHLALEGPLARVLHLVPLHFAFRAERLPTESTTPNPPYQIILTTKLPHCSVNQPHPGFRAPKAEKKRM